MTATVLRTRIDGLPVYGLRHLPDLPPVDTVALSDAQTLGHVHLSDPHTHEFFVVAYFERDGGTLRIGSREHAVAAGDVHLLAPGDTVTVVGGTERLGSARGHAVCFSPAAIGAQGSGGPLSWRAHPLLFPFAHPTTGDAKRLQVPADERAAWTARLQDLADELDERRHGYRDAVDARLTLLLIDIARMAPRSDDRIGVDVEGILTEVLEFVDLHYRDGISLRDVARAVHRSPGHLTTVVRRTSGRTVQEWITERRLAEARRLLVETNLAIEEIGRSVGYRDPSFFARTFRRRHGISPSGWRRAAHA